MTKIMIEKRKHPRYPLQITMSIHAKGQSLGKYRGSISDLSVGGMSFRSDAELEAGMTLYLKLNIPLEIRGEVRHMKGPDGAGVRSYGVRFHRIGVPDPTRPAEFISAQFQRTPRSLS